MDNEFLHKENDQVRLVIAGSVDDGKSTLVGRLLHDTKSILADTYDAMVAASTSRGSENVDLALLTDGLRAEREQGITIDVAYRYFSTPKRSFVLADTPGHEQYTRNMITGASTADIAVILVDVRNGISLQTRRHAALMSLLRMSHVIFAVNKMDAVDWSHDRFTEVSSDIETLARKLNLPNFHILPLSALTGEGVVSPPNHGFDSPALLDLLETIPVTQHDEAADFRMPVQLVIRPRTPEHPDYRGLAGRVTSGSIHVGDRVFISSSKSTSEVVAIDAPQGSSNQAVAGESVVIRLADEIDVARGEVLSLGKEPILSTEINGTVVWLAGEPSRLRSRVLVKIGSKLVRGILSSIDSHWSVDSSEWNESSESLTLNDIGRVKLILEEQVATDPYAHHLGTGTFLMIDTISGATLAGGMII